jgi:hypothetical protein
MMQLQQVPYLVGVIFRCLNIDHVNKICMEIVTAAQSRYRCFLTPLLFPDAEIEH